MTTRRCMLLFPLLLWTIFAVWWPHGDSRLDAHIPLYITADYSADPAVKTVVRVLENKAAQTELHFARSRPLTCAVVGNSGNLRGSAYGALIDQHDYIFRMNTAPTKGFERDVGARTTHHVMHSNQPHADDFGPGTITILVIDDFNVDAAQYRKNTTLYLEYLAGEPVDLPWNSASFDNDFPDNVFALSGGVRIMHPAFIDEINNRWFRPGTAGNIPFSAYPSTGFKTVILALRLCDKVDVFGFGANKTAGTWDHYFDAGDALNTWPALHRADYQEQFLDDLERRELIKIYRGKR